MGSPGVQVLAEVGLTEAEDPREGSADLLPLDRGADLPHPRLRLLVLGEDAVELGGGDDPLVPQAADPLQAELGELALRLGGRELGPFLPGVEAREQGTGTPPHGQTRRRACPRRPGGLR